MDSNAGSAQESLGGDDQGQERRYSEEEVSKLLNERLAPLVSARVNELNQKHQKDMDSLKDEFKQTQKPKKYTRAELNAAVEQNKISDIEAQSIFDRQQTDEVEERAQTTAERVINERDQQARTQASIARYTDFDSDLNVEGSEARNRIIQEVQAQMSITGQESATLATEHAALRVIYGPEENLGKGKEHSRQTHQDTFTGSDGATVIQDKGWSEGLTPRMRDHYQKQIDSGMMTLEAVKAEIPFINKDVARRAAAR